MENVEGKRIVIDLKRLVSEGAKQNNERETV